VRASKLELLLSPIPISLHLEPMQLDGRLRNSLLDKEIGDLDSLISLELNDLAKLLVVNESAIASKLLLKRL